MNKVKLLQGEVMDRLTELSDESVHCIITSPPYWQLRDYGCSDQIGLELTIEEYVNKLVEVFRELRRVLRKDGVCFINLGDSYATHGGCKGSKHSHNFRKPELAEKEGIYRSKPFGSKIGLKEKDLCGIPWRVALALQADGWWLRSDIIWAKPNPMPESVTDRPTRSHEYIFLLTKSAKYFWDQEAVREESIGNNHHDLTGCGYLAPGQTPHSGNRKTTEARTGRNIRSVWNIATTPFPEAHFATFSPALVEKCIKAGTSEKGVCPKCGSPWMRVVEKKGGSIGKSWHNHETDLALGQRCTLPEAKGSISRCDSEPYRVNCLGWHQGCLCSLEGIDNRKPADPISATVLDPFSGSGTTCLVAAKLQRNSIGIELKPEYVEMAKKRLRKELGFLVQVTTQSTTDHPKVARLAGFEPATLGLEVGSSSSEKPDE